MKLLSKKKNSEEEQGNLHMQDKKEQLLTVRASVCQEEIKVVSEPETIELTQNKELEVNMGINHLSSRSKLNHKSI